MQIPSCINRHKKKSPTRIVKKSVVSIDFFFIIGVSSTAALKLDSRRKVFCLNIQIAVLLFLNQPNGALPQKIPKKFL